MLVWYGGVPDLLAAVDAAVGTPPHWEYLVCIEILSLAESTPGMDCVLCMDFPGGCGSLFFSPTLSTFRQSPCYSQDPVPCWRKQRQSEVTSHPGLQKNVTDIAISQFVCDLFFRCVPHHAMVAPDPRGWTQRFLLGTETWHVITVPHIFAPILSPDGGGGGPNFSEWHSHPDPLYSTLTPLHQAGVRVAVLVGGCCFEWLVSPWQGEEEGRFC